MRTRARGPMDSDPSRVIMDTPTPSGPERSLATVPENLSTLQGEISTLFNRLQGTDFKSTEPVDKGFSKYLPAPFTGDPTENINEFLEKFNTYCDFVRYNDAKRCDLLPMLLTGRALSWFRSLPRTGRSWNETEKLVKDKYGPSAIGYVQQSILLEKIQGSTESVKKYADDVFKRLYLTGTKDPEAWKIFAKGLRPIKFLVLQKQPETLDQAQKYAFEAEQLITLQQPALLKTCTKMFESTQSVNPSACSNTDPAANKSGLSAMQTQLQQLADKLDRMTQQVTVSTNQPATTTAVSAMATQPVSQMETLVSTLASLVIDQSRQHQVRGRSRGRGRGFYENHGNRRYNDPQRTSDGRPICGSCGRVGHYTQSCRERLRTPTRRGNCRVCNSPDHWANRCPRRSNDGNNNNRFFTH